MRLNRFLAAAGLGSRRSCEELILSGQVTINGATCANLATQVGPEDVVKVGNRVLHTVPPATLLLHKPPGFVCTAADERGRRTIFDLLPSNFPRLFHVGRLDKESEGLLILTNDGELSLKLTHPRYKVEKEYEVVLDKSFDFTLTDKLTHGISTPEGWAKAESAHKLGNNKLKIILRQGLKRQIRLMFHGLGYEVIKLVRTRIGPIQIRNIPAGAWRVLTQREIDSLLEAGAAGAAKEEPRPRKAAAASRSGKPPRAAKPRGAKAGGPPRKFARSSGASGGLRRSGPAASRKSPDKGRPAR